LLVPLAAASTFGSLLLPFGFPFFYFLLMSAGRSDLAQGFFTSRVHLISVAADHLVESFLFDRDSRVDKVFESGRVRRDVVEFHGDRFSGGNLHAVFNEGLKMYVLFVLFLAGCKVGLPGSDKECFDQLFEAIFKANDVGNACCGESSMFVGGGRIWSSC
jgi:hypothetical protein